MFPSKGMLGDHSITSQLGLAPILLLFSRLPEQLPSHLKLIQISRTSPLFPEHQLSRSSLPAKPSLQHKSQGSLHRFSSSKNTDISHNPKSLNFPLLLILKDLPVSHTYRSGHSSIVGKDLPSWVTLRSKSLNFPLLLILKYLPVSHSHLSVHSNIVGKYLRS